MEASTVSIDQVRSLVSERQRYDDWLQALEAKRAETPVRVYERVQADYRSRRNEVTARLREHVEMLSALQAELEGRQGVADAELTELEDARAEAMLRTAVGEFDSERWEQVRRDVETGIAEQTAARASLVGELEEVRTLLANARPEQPQVVAGAEKPSVAAPAPEAEPELLDMSVEEVPTPAVTAPETRDDLVSLQGGTEPTDVETVTVDSITQWESVLGSSTADMQDDVLPIAPERREAFVDDQPQSATNVFHEDFVTPRGHQPDAPNTSGADDTFDDLAFLRSVVDPTSSSSNRENAAGSGNQNRGGSSVADQQKTLRCTDCGTMNLPTEWYCERCGGELAAF